MVNLLQSERDALAKELQVMCATEEDVRPVAKKQAVARLAWQFRIGKFNEWTRFWMGCQRVHERWMQGVPDVLTVRVKVHWSTATGFQW